jgi:magnesium-transporting ATPase (P-type)
MNNFMNALVKDGQLINVDGDILCKMELSEVARQSDYCSIFARLTPSQKGALNRLFQQKGHCIAMVGDGPNDGIALKVADIGISFVMNSSPIAKRLSKILINDLADLLRLIESLFTHYKREEDTSMESGKFDEELGRMSDIVDHIAPDSMVLFNESFSRYSLRRWYSSAALLWRSWAWLCGE